MSAWEDVNDVYGHDIGEAAEVYVKASNVLPFSAKKLEAVFNAQEMEDVAKMLVELKKATGDNTRQAAALKQFSNVAAKLVKLLAVAV